MPIIQVPDIALKLYRRFRLESVPDSLLAPETVPVVIVEDLVGYNITGAERECRGSSGQAATVAEYSISGLVNFNPNAGIRVTGVWLTSTTAQLMTLLRPTAGIVGMVNSTDKSFMDFRIAGEPQASVQKQAIVALPIGRALWQLSVLATTPIYIPLDVTLKKSEVSPMGAMPDRAILAMTTVANTNLDVCWEWTEGAQEG